MTAVRFGREGARARALVPTWQLPASVRSARQANAVAPAAARRSDPDRLWLARAHRRRRVALGARRVLRGPRVPARGLAAALGGDRRRGRARDRRARVRAAPRRAPRAGRRPRGRLARAGRDRRRPGHDLDAVRRVRRRRAGRPRLTPGLLYCSASHAADVVWLQALATMPCRPSPWRRRSCRRGAPARSRAGRRSTRRRCAAGVLLAGVIAVTPLVQAWMQRAFTAGCGDLAADRQPVLAGRWAYPPGADRARPRGGTRPGPGRPGVHRRSRSACWPAASCVAPGRRRRRTRAGDLLCRAVTVVPRAPARDPGAPRSAGTPFARARAHGILEQSTQHEERTTRRRTAETRGWVGARSRRPRWRCGLHQRAPRGLRRPAQGRPALAPIPPVVAPEPGRRQPPARTQPAGDDVRYRGDDLSRYLFDDQFVFSSAAPTRGSTRRSD